jgi:hypothetical protein
MKHASLLAAAAVVIATNAIVLVGIARNRSTVTEEIELTQRELTVRRSGEDNSGVSLWLTWIDPAVYGEGPYWFGQAKLAEVGFDVRTPVTDPGAEIKYRDVLTRDAFVVFENGGAAWDAWRKAEEERQARYSSNLPGRAQPYTGTRLTAVDAGRDPAALRRRYPDQSKFLIVRAVVHLYYQKRWDRATAREMPPAFLRGSIQAVEPNEIHVPLAHAFSLSGATSYSVTLRYGSRYEPWITSIQRK